MHDILFVRNEAEMTPFSTQNRKEKFQGRLQTPEWFMIYHKADGRHIVHYMPKIK